MTKSKNYRVAVIGASGYGGIQSIRLLKDHPNFSISYLGGNQTAGKRWNTIAPYLTLKDNPLINKPNIKEITDACEFAILSLPNGEASKITPALIEKGVRVIDLSADYRFKSLSTWKEVYKKESIYINRQDEELFSESVYGLSEWYSDSISKSNIISCPGCFPTASLLALLPFISQGLIETEGIIIDAKSGTSGGGKIPKEHLLLSESSESISPYGVIGHRHTSEIEEQASLVAGRKIEIQFTPHLVPMVRGILSTIYARLRDPGLTADDCTTLLGTFYQGDPFIEVLPVGLYPSTKWVRYSNKAQLSVQVDKRNGRIVLMSAIDNLIKGQAGQAIQNLNLLVNLPVQTGLPINNFYP